MIESPGRSHFVDHLEGEHDSAAGTVTSVGVVPALRYDCWTGRSDTVQPHGY